MSRTAWSALMLPGDLPPLIPLFPEWYDEAACGGVDLGVFFGEHKGHRSSDAKLFCNGCPVRQACLDHAIEHDLHGVWGGMTRPERKALERDVRLSDACKFSLTTDATPPTAAESDGDGDDDAAVFIDTTPMTRIVARVLVEHAV